MKKHCKNSCRVTSANPFTCLRPSFASCKTEIMAQTCQALQNDKDYAAACSLFSNRLHVTAVNRLLCTQNIFHLNNH